MDDTRAVIGTPLRFAYADPPYPGQSRWLYADHPDYAGDVDHAELITRLERDYPDGWALSTSAQALRDVLLLCPAGVRVAAWHKSNPPPIRTTGRWIWAWEPVIIQGGRQRRGEDVPDVKDGLIAPNMGRMPACTITGQKPTVFTRWVMDLLGVLPGDKIDDLFAGSGSVGMEMQAILRQETLRRPDMPIKQEALTDVPPETYRDRSRSAGKRKRANGGRVLR